MRQRHLAPGLECHTAPAPRHLVRLFRQADGSQVEVALHELEDCLPDRRRPDEALEAAETAALISAFLRRQTPEDRALFVRRYFSLTPLGELAEQFGMTTGQVKSRLHRMRQRLKLELEREGVAV